MDRCEAWLAQALAIIREFEGCELVAYPDPGSGGDPWTVGYGATGDGIGPGTIWTQEQANERLAADVARFDAGVMARVRVPLAPHERAALVSFAYNVGLQAFGHSTLLRKLNAGDKAGAIREFARWNKASGKVMAGLTRRRAAEAALFQGA